jgi:lipopolysaccharide transport system permease protein
MVPERAPVARPDDALLPSVAGLALPVTFIRPDNGEWWPRLREVWDFRELLFFLTWRDVKIRYKQTALGASWAVLQPVLTMLVFSLFFGTLAKIPSDGVPYPIFAFCGLLPWQLFSYALVNSANSLVANERLVSRVYFPRLIIPLASVLAGLVDFAIAFVVLLLMMFHYRMLPTAAIWTLPLFVLLAVLAALAVGLGLSALNVRFRDVRHALPFLTQIWLFATPIAYPSSLVPAKWRALYGINPMAGVVEGFRWALLAGTAAPGPLVLVSSVVVIVGLVIGLLYFMSVERSFADVL